MEKQVIEYAGIPVGIVIPDQDGVRFIAVKLHVYDLNDMHFSSSLDVVRAIHDMMQPDVAAKEPRHKQELSEDGQAAPVLSVIV